jgi:hypothetical protein
VAFALKAPATTGDMIMNIFRMRPSVTCNSSSSAKRLRRRKTCRALLASVAVVAAGATVAGCGGPTADLSEDEATATQTQAIDFTDPSVTKYLGPGLGAILELGKDVGGVYTSFEEAWHLTQKIHFLLGIGPDPDINPLSEIMMEQIKVIQGQLTNVTNLIVDDGWHTAELQGQGTFSNAMYAASRATQWAAGNSGTIPESSSDWLTLDSLSRTATTTFADRVWFYWPYRTGVSRYNWAPEPSNNEIFDWRLGLPRFVNAITARLLVLSVTRADFRQDSLVHSELLGYRGRLKEYYDKAQSVAIKCQVQTPPTFTQGDLSLLPIYCTNAVTGTRLPAGTAGHPADFAPLQLQLMDEIGFGPLRALMSNLYELSWNIIGDNANAVSRVEKVPFKGMDMCVEPSSVPPTIHTQLVMRTCTNVANSGKNWNLEYRSPQSSGSDYAARLRYGDTDLCVNVPWASATMHNVLQLYPCSTGTPYSNELFDHTAATQLEYGGLCFNLAGGVATDGAVVQLYPCVGANNEKWAFR